MTATGQPNLEATPVGGALCLFRPDSGALGLLNGAAREVWDASGLASVRQLTEISTLLQPTAPPPVQVPFAAPDGPAALMMSIALPSRQGAVRLVCHEPWLAELFAAVLSPLRATGLAEPFATVTVARHEAGAHYRLWRSGVADVRSISRAEIRRRVLIEVASALHGRDRVAAVLHGSAVGIDGGAILVAGRSGAGKSTLTAALVAAGTDYLGDDLVPLDADGVRILPFPSALSVKSGSWRGVGAAFPALGHQPIHAMRDLKIRYLPLPAAATVASRVRGIVFPSFEPGSPLAVRRLAPEETFALLVDAGSEIVGEPPSAKPLVMLAESVPGVHLAYGDTAAALDAIRTLGVCR